MTVPAPLTTGCVLVVGADDSIAMPVRCGLERAGHRVERAATGADALDRLEVGDVTLIVLDSASPGPVPRLVRAAAGAALPVLVLTHRQAQRPSPAVVAHLTMPFTLGELIATVAALAGSSQTARVPAARRPTGTPGQSAASPCAGTPPATVVGQVPQKVV
jgi:DNA-binding response OmpR family regulator